MSLPIRSTNRTLVYAGIGAHKVHPNSEEARLARGVAVRLAALGFDLSSGGADGIDFAFERGAGPARRIFRPSYDAQKRLPAGYTVVQSPDVLTRARTIAEATTQDWHGLDTFGRDLHVRNVFAVLGADLASPVDFVVAFPAADPRQRGTRMTMAVAAGKHIPVVDLTVPIERAAFLGHLEGMEEGPASALAPRDGELFPTFALTASGDRRRPIAISVANIRDTGPWDDALRAKAFYIGRNGARVRQQGFQSAGLGNKFVVGTHGLQNHCADLFAFALGDELARGNAELENRLARVANAAVEHGAVALVCHCHPRPCHGDAIALAVGNRLTDLGYAVDYVNLAPERRLHLAVPNDALSEAERVVADRGLTPSLEHHRPWTVTRGEIVAQDPRHSYLHAGGGSLQRIANERFATLPERNQTIALVQHPNGSLETRLSRNRELAASRSR